MEFVSVFDEASRDFESEDREHRLTAATVEAQTLWPFLALAQSREEFGHRLALRQDRLSAIAVKHGVDLAEVVGPFYRGYEALHTEAGAEDVGAGKGKVQTNVVGCPDCDSSGRGKGGERNGCQTCNGGGKVRTGTGSDGRTFHIPAPYASLHEAKVKCRRCNHDNAPHTQGAVCPCGCTTFSPKTAGVISRKIAGRDEWEHDCTSCGKTSTSTRQHMDCPNCGEKGEEIYTSYKTSSVYDSPENHQCENDGNGRCKHCSQDIPKDLQDKTGSYDDPPQDAEVAGYSSQHGDAIEDHYGPSYDPEVIHELPLNGTKSNPVLFYNEGYHHGFAGVEHKGYGGRDAAVLYGTGYRHGKQDRTGAHFAMLHQALMEGQDPLTWIQQQNGSPSPANALVPSHHDDTQKFVADDTTGGNQDALDQALDKEGSLPF